MSEDPDEDEFVVVSRDLLTVHHTARQYNMVEIVTEVEATPEKIRHKFHTASVGAEKLCFDGCCLGP